MFAAVFGLVLETHSFRRITGSKDAETDSWWRRNMDAPKSLLCGRVTSEPNPNRPCRSRIPETCPLIKHVALDSRLYLCGEAWYGLLCSAFGQYQQTQYPFGQRALFAKEQLNLYHQWVFLILFGLAARDVFWTLFHQSGGTFFTWV